MHFGTSNNFIVACKKPFQAKSKIIYYLIIDLISYRLQKGNDNSIVGNITAHLHSHFTILKHDVHDRALGVIKLMTVNRTLFLKIQSIKTRNFFSSRKCFNVFIRNATIL